MISNYLYVMPEIGKLEVRHEKVVSRQDGASVSVPCSAPSPKSLLSHQHAPDNNTGSTTLFTVSHEKGGGGDRNHGNGPSTGRATFTGDEVTYQTQHVDKKDVTREGPIKGKSDEECTSTSNLVTSQELSESLQLLRYDLHREVQQIIREQVRQFSIAKVKSRKRKENVYIYTSLVSVVKVMYYFRVLYHTFLFPLTFTHIA